MSFPTRELEQRTNIPNQPDRCYKISLVHAHRTFYNAMPKIDIYFSHAKRINFIVDPNQDDKFLHNFIAIIWNNLHTDMKNIKNKETFKTHIKMTNNDNLWILYFYPFTIYVSFRHFLLLLIYIYIYIYFSSTFWLFYHLFIHTWLFHPWIYFLSNESTKTRQRRVLATKWQ